MKKRINTIKDKILVQGGTDNELKNHEIRLNSDFSFSERVGSKVVNVGGGGSSLDLESIGYKSDDKHVQKIFDYAIEYAKNFKANFKPGFTLNRDKQLMFAPVIDITTTDISGLFSDFTGLITIPLLNTSNVTNMYLMFLNCNSLVTVPLIDTSSVTNMNSMFNGCNNLIEIPAFDMKNVTNTTLMFYNCSNLVYIPALNTENVVYFEGMFSMCHNLKTIESLDMSSIEEIYNMFLRCMNVTYALFKNIGKSNLSNWNFVDLTAWGSGSEKNRQSVIDSLLTYSYDRTGNGLSTVTILLSSYLQNLITPEELSQIQAKGYDVLFRDPYAGE